MTIAFASTGRTSKNRNSDIAIQQCHCIHSEFTGLHRADVNELQLEDRVVVVGTVCRISFEEVPGYSIALRIVDVGP